MCEQGLSVGIYESPRQFNQQPQFASTVYAPRMCVPNWQQSQGLSSALWSDQCPLSVHEFNPVHISSQTVCVDCFYVVHGKY